MEKKIPVAELKIGEPIRVRGDNIITNHGFGGALGGSQVYTFVVRKIGKQLISGEPLGWTIRRRGAGRRFVCIEVEPETTLGRPYFEPKGA